MTEYGAEGSWYSMDKVRFRKGLPQSIGGWQKVQPNTFKGIARQNMEFSTLAGYTYLALATQSHTYLWDGGTFYDITPVETSISVSNAMQVSAGAVSVITSINTHGRQAGSYIDVSATDTVGGLTISGEYLISSVIDANTLVFTTSTTATGTSTVAGGTITGFFPIQAGLDSNTLAYGWGSGSYSEGAYGVGGSGGVIQRLRTWSMSSWGEDVLMNYYGGPLYWWDATSGTGTRAVVVTAAPSIIDYHIISFPTRHAVAFGTHDVSGTFDPLLVRWSDSEDFNSWTPAATNTAGDFRLEQGSKIYSVCKSKAETIIWTDNDVHSMRWIGGDFEFSFDKIGSNCGIIGPNARIDVGGTIFWMGTNGFYSYDGKINPLNCTIQKDIFDADGEFVYDSSQKEKVFCGHNEQFKEIIWLYQSTDSTTEEVNRYVIYNYIEDLWYYGTINRTTWLDVGLFNSVLATGDDNYIYQHELGLTADNDPIDSYIESAPFDLGDGDKLMFVDRLIPDFSLVGTLGITITTKVYPGGDEVVKGPYVVEPDTTKIDLRARGRQVKVRIGTSAAGSAWQLGKMRVRAKENGRA